MSEHIDQATAFVLDKADTIAKAIERKFEREQWGAVKVFVRVHKTAEYDFVELGVKHVNKEEIQVAYSETYFEAMTTPEITKERAQRILRDACIHLGFKP